jgi:hypothetical protein
MRRAVGLVRWEASMLPLSRNRIPSLGAGSEMAFTAAPPNIELGPAGKSRQKMQCHPLFKSYRRLVQQLRVSLCGCKVLASPPSGVGNCDIQRFPCDLCRGTSLAYSPTGARGATYYGRAS